MSHKIIKPEGIELIEYLNNGYAICNRCGAVMRQTEDPKTGCGIYICPSCGLKMDEEDYEYESDEEVEWTGCSYESKNIYTVVGYTERVGSVWMDAKLGNHHW